MKREKVDKTVAQRHVAPKMKDIEMTIDGEKFSLNIEASEEIEYRSGADLFKKVINSYRATTPLEEQGAEAGRCRLMAGLEMAVLYQRGERLRDPEPMKQRLEALCEELEGFIDRQEQDELWQSVARNIDA